MQLFTDAPNILSLGTNYPLSQFMSYSKLSQLHNHFVMYLNTITNPKIIF